MSFLIGTDEAGYGPNLGPLTITGTLWENRGIEEDLYEALSAVVAATRKQAKTSTPHPRILVADSKQVYQSSGTIHDLELGVLAIAQWLQGKPLTRLTDLLDALSAHTPWQGSQKLPPWINPIGIELPLVARPELIADAAGRLSDAASKASIRLISIDCRVVFPGQFNQRIRQLGNKAHVLSDTTLQIASGLKQRADSDLEIVCDKHGGRSRYAGLIRQHLTDQLVYVGEESRHQSDYFFRENDRDVVVRFQAGGEAFLPTAVASMVSKYIREAFMRIWNDFWQQHVSDLKPTKGYPVDAKRFKSEIESAQRNLGISDEQIWRCR